MKTLTSSELSSLTYLKDFSKDLKYKILGMTHRESFIEELFDLIKEYDSTNVDVQNTIKEREDEIESLKDELKSLKETLEDLRLENEEVHEKE
jgi:chromosome segregation ATPase